MGRGVMNKERLKEIADALQAMSDALGDAAGSGDEAATKLFGCNSLLERKILQALKNVGRAQSRIRIAKALLLREEKPLD